MRVGGRPGPVKMRTSPPAYPMQQENAGLRLPLIYILCILWRASLVNHSILLTQTIRELHLPPANQCSPACRLSKPLQGNDNLFILCLSYSCFCTNPLIFSVQVKPSKRTKRSKPAEEPISAEPELRTAAPDTSAHEPPPEPAHDTPTLTTDPLVEQAMEGSKNPETLARPRRMTRTSKLSRLTSLNRGDPPRWPSAPPKKNFWNAAKPGWMSLIMLI